MFRRARTRMYRGEWTPRKVDRLTCVCPALAKRTEIDRLAERRQIENVVVLVRCTGKQQKNCSIVDRP